MEIQHVGKLHLWTSGDGSVGISGESAEVYAPGWLLSSEHFDAEDFNPPWSSSVRKSAPPSI